MWARSWAAALTAGLLLSSASSAATLTLTGADLLTKPNASFPSVQPKTAGNSIYFEWGTSHGPPLMNLVRYRVNSDGALSLTGDVTISAVWNVTRLACIGFCAGGADDWDPSFFLSDGTTMIGWGLGDNNAGQVVPSSDTDTGATGVNRNVYAVLPNAGIPPIGADADVLVSFTLHDSGVTGLIRYMGVGRAFDWNQTLGRTTNLALVLGQDNDSGERYQVNSLQLPSAAPEPATLTLMCLGAVGLAIARRRRQ